MCSREVSWWLQTTEDGKNKQLRRDAVITYEHGKGFMPIQVQEHFVSHKLWSASVTEYPAESGKAGNRPAFAPSTP